MTPREKARAVSDGEQCFVSRYLWAALVLTSLLSCWGALDASARSPLQTRQTPPPNALYGEAILLGHGREWRPYPLLVDIDQDGRLDIVATHRKPLDQNALHIWLGNGVGAFRALPQTWPSPGYSGLAAGDINRDGHLDLVAASHFSRLHTFLGDGAGRFTDHVVKTGDGYTSSELVDIDGDGQLDAILLGWQKTGIEIYRGNGDGSWALATRLMAGAIGRDLAAADVNEDGKVDLVVATANRGVIVYLQNHMGDWVAQPTGFQSATHEFRSLAVGDINRDGRLDIALNGGFQGPRANNGPDVYLGDGRGKWTPSSNGLKVAPSPPAWGIALGDVNQDSHLDIVAGGVTGGSRHRAPFGLFLYAGDGQGNWSLRTQSGLPTTGLSLPYSIRLNDLNQDGRLDIIVVHGATQDSEGYLSVWFHR